MPRTVLDVGRVPMVHAGREVRRNVVVVTLANHRLRVVVALGK
jgi:ribosomal protein L14E/L6E/L27E